MLNQVKVVHNLSRRPTGIRRKRKSPFSSAVRPETQVKVSEAFQSVIQANDRAIAILYNNK